MPLILLTDYRECLQINNFERIFLIEVQILFLTYSYHVLDAVSEIHLYISSHWFAVDDHLRRRLFEALAELPGLVQGMVNDGELLVLVAQDGSRHRADNDIALKFAIKKNVDESGVEIWIIQ